MLLDSNSLYQEETFELIGIAMEIHRILGGGFLEVVYKDAFELELRDRGIVYEREKEFKIAYKGRTLTHRFYADFVIGGKIILELKSRAGIVDLHYSQVLNYLAVSKLKIGLIFNFQGKSLAQKRVIFTPKA